MTTCEQVSLWKLELTPLISKNVIYEYGEKNQQNYFFAVALRMVKFH